MISIIIAAYNVEKYIEETLDSALCQTYKDIEIICVDDCSTDSTFDIIQRYAEKDPRIKPIRHEVNLGTCAVRKTGLMAAKGEYITFLDGDDCLDAQACELYLQAARTRNVDIVHSNAVLFDTYHVPKEHLDNLEAYLQPCTKELPVGRGELVNSCFIDRDFCWNLWGKLLRREIVEKAYALYDNQRILVAEDLMILFMVLVYAKGYAAIPQRLYHYRQNSGITSVTVAASLRQMEKFSEEYQVYTLLRQWLTQLGLEKRYRDALNQVNELIVHDTAYYLFHTLPQSQASKAVDILARYWPVENLTASLACAFHQLNYIEPSEGLWRIRKAELFAQKPREVRTVGMFYYRMYSGGIERVISNLTPLLMERGLRVVLFTEEITDADYPLPEGVVRVKLPAITNGSYKNFYDRCSVFRSAIQEHHVDVMLYHAWVNLFLPADQMFVKSTGIPFILHTHGFATHTLEVPPSPYTKLAASQQYFYALCDTVVCLSEVDRSWWESFGFRSVTTVNPQVYSLKDITPALPGTKDVLWVGRLDEVKRPFDALRIAQRVHDQLPDFHLHMVGRAETDEYLHNMQRYIKSHHMGSYVTLEGYHSDPTPFYRSCSAVLWTASMEGAPMGMAEAKIFGLPIVTYELANVDMVRDERGMFVVEQGDRVGAAAALVELLSDPEKLQAASLEARRSAEAMFDIDYAARWIAFFEESFQPRPPRKMDYQVAPLNAAVRMTMFYAYRGACTAANAGASGYVPSNLAAECNALDATIKEIRSSTSYRVGLFITSIPRAVKTLLRRLIGRG